MDRHTVMDRLIFNSILTRSQQELSRDILTLLSDVKFTDIEITCGEKTFSCHKNILSARSPVFKAMFQADMKETTSGKVEIKDYSPDVIQQMIRFIYSSRPFDETNVGDREQIVELLRAADQYKLDLLKEACEAKLSESLNLNNCLLTLIMGDIYNAKGLRRCSMKMLVEKMNQELLRECPDDWTKCTKVHPDLIVEITKEYFKAWGMEDKIWQMNIEHPSDADAMQWFRLLKIFAK